MEVNFYEILEFYGFKPPLEIKQIYKSAWLIENEYVLKVNDRKTEADKALKINGFLLAEGVPAAEYLPTVSGEKFVIFKDRIYTLMRKMKGESIEPFDGDYTGIAFNVGVETARLHKALKSPESWRASIRTI